MKRQVVGFKKIKFYTLENIGAGTLSLPEQEMHTTAFWLHFESGFVDDFEGFSRADISVPVTMESAVEPEIVLYDYYPGGIGQSDPLFRRSKELLSAALDLASACPCESGCPSCVGPFTKVGMRGKEGAVRILRKTITT